MRLESRLFLSLVLLPGTLWGAEPQILVKDIEGRPGVVTRVLVVKPERPRATVVLLAGGAGILNIAPDGAIGNGTNFLVRSRGAFVRHGLMAAVVDAPSDRLPFPGLTGFRKSAEHAADLGAVVAALREEAGVPVWLVGTSRGSASAANGAIRLQKAGGNGIVLTSSIVAPEHIASLVTMELEKITVPALVVHHVNDACPSTLMSGVPAMLDRLRRAPIEVHQLTIRGGRTPEPGADPCGPFHYHGYLGIEDAVVARIARWVLTGKP